MGVFCNEKIRLFFRRRLGRMEKRDKGERRQSNKGLQITTEKNDLSKKIMRDNKVWTIKQEEDELSEEAVNIVYTYEDLVSMYEKFNFLLFMTITTLVTIVFMVVLETGG